MNEPVNDSGPIVWASIIGGFSLLLGAVSFTRVNLKTVNARRPGWGYSLITLIAVVAVGLPSIFPTRWSALLGRNAGSLNAIVRSHHLEDLG